MRKTRQLFTAASLAAAAAMAAQPVLAAEGIQKGWRQEDGRWVYLKSDGSRETDTWIKGEDGFRYYVDEDGYMAVDSIIEDNDDLYYVDENGVRVSERWVSRPNEDSECDQDVEVLWYYFGKNGKAEKEEGKKVKLMEGSAERYYFFDSDGHMLSGWQKIRKKGDDNEKIWYLGDENQGYVHRFWQQLEPDEEVLDLDGRDYQSLEMFYFGWNGDMTGFGESKLENEHFMFDENGVMLKGWYPNIIADTPQTAVNRFYDEETGIRAKEWLYAYDPGDEGGDPHWLYCDKNTGLVYNEGGRDSDDQVAYKNINNKTYFFDPKGHMITGLIATDGTDLSANPFAEDEFGGLTGDIGKDGNVKAAGIYYLSQQENTLGQLQKDQKLCLKNEYETYYYELDKKGRAYQNALIKDCIYGADGAMVHSDSGWQVIAVDEDIYEKDKTDEPKIPAGSQIAVNQSGKVKKNGTVKIDGISYEVKDYIVVSE